VYLLVYRRIYLGRRGTVGLFDLLSVNTCHSWVWAPSKVLVVSLSKKLYPNCLVLVSSRNGFKRDIHIKAKLVCFTIVLK